jgi:hypothetical protein
MLQHFDIVQDGRECGVSNLTQDGELADMMQHFDIVQDGRECRVSNLTQEGELVMPCPRFVTDAWSSAPLN